MTIETVQDFANRLTGAGNEVSIAKAALAAIADQSGGQGEQTIATLDALLLLLAAQRNELATALGQPPIPNPALQLAKEMQGVIIDAWMRWDRYDQEDSPALGERLERYAGLSLEHAEQSIAAERAQTAPAREAYRG